MTENVLNIEKNNCKCYNLLYIILYKNTKGDNMLTNLKKIIINNYKLIIFFICLILFLALAEDVFNHDIMNGDIIGYNLISKYLINDSMTVVMKFITWFGSVICIGLLTIILFILLKNKKIGFLIFANLVIVTILNQLFKFILARPRPSEYRIINETGYSFPSGHSMVSMAFYGFLIYLIYKYVGNKYLKWTSMILLFLLIIVIGISRIYLGVHYTSDVIAGFLVAISYLILYINISKRLVFNKIDIKC